MDTLAEVGEVRERRTTVLHRVRVPRTAAGEARAPRPEALHVLTCGSVDDGKSTLIGRMLVDAGAVHADQRQVLEKAKRTAAGTLDFSLLLDGLVAEREQGITIDIAWRYFDTAARRLVIIDAPGHEQYTRNMATGASHADVAILLVDARSGVKIQTRRHAAILDLMGVQRVVLAVNKMDLAGWSEVRFRAIEHDFQALARRFGFTEAVAIPVSAVLGDNVAHRSRSMPWYEGPSLLEHLDATPSRGLGGGEFRFPVQTVVRAGQDFRGLAGTVTSGEVARGGEVADALSGRRARVRRIVTMGRDLQRASAGQAVVLQLDTDLDISRGAVLASPQSAPPAVKSLDARMVWLSDQPFARERGYLLRTATDLVPVAALLIAAHLDLDALTERPATTCTANDIAVARIALGRSAVVERYAEQRDTGSFVLVDAVTGATVAGGVVSQTHAHETGQQPLEAFRLTRSLLRQGIGADLGDDLASERELRRRADEVAILLRGAGIAVEIEDRWQAGRIDVRAVWLGFLAALSFGFAAAIVFGAV